MAQTSENTSGRSDESERPATGPDEPPPPVLLVVEDEPDTAALITMLMKREGYQVIHAPDGHQAFLAIDVLLPPALVLLDIRLPDTDGLKILDYIKEARPEWAQVPVVMLTANADERDVRQSAALGANEYILKPFQPERLVARLRKFRPAREGHKPFHPGQRPDMTKGAQP